jgi:hypothetical protein
MATAQQQSIRILIGATTGRFTVPITSSVAGSMTSIDPTASSDVQAPSMYSS